ncbi:hypothetical protein MMC21_007401 [Puttea exsequens]|nr:hypothetical protein [Puttea exsequens]
MDRMLENYANATYMVVHDLSLVNFEWKDDGTPAIAVALSPWFTRGWTAAELFSTRPDKGSVKVLFKDPNQDNTEPLIKDLDTENYPFYTEIDERTGDHIVAPLAKHLKASNNIVGKRSYDPGSSLMPPAR